MEDVQNPFKMLRVKVVPTFVTKMKLFSGNYQQLFTNSFLPVNVINQKYTNPKRRQSDKATS
jgi:hypothetical protein